jgi:hypothetical protein
VLRSIYQEEFGLFMVLVKVVGGVFVRFFRAPLHRSVASRWVFLQWLHFLHHQVNFVVIGVIVLCLSLLQVRLSIVALSASRRYWCGTAVLLFCGS